MVTCGNSLVNGIFDRNQLIMKWPDVMNYFAAMAQREIPERVKRTYGYQV